MSDSMIDFSTSLYNQLSSNAGENDSIFFSPISIYFALTMTYCGARNKTAEEMKNVLKLNGKPEEKNVHEQISLLQKKLCESSSNQPVTLNIANRIWTEQSYKILEEFQNLVSTYYGASAQMLNFKGDTNSSRLQINEWVENVTNKKIMNLLSPDAVNSDTRLILTNAIYFKGLWKSQFKKQNTKVMPFHRTPSLSLDVPMMFQKEKFNFVEDNNLDCKVLNLPYQGGNIKMTIILPNAVDGLRKLEHQIIGNKSLYEWMFTITTDIDVEVYIPIFTFTQTFQLSDILKQLGMNDLFDINLADLSGISSTKDLFVSSVIHKAFVEVNEEGTEAAAATAVVMMFGCAMTKPVAVFKADHPFLFMIHDTVSKTILFMGRVCG